MKRIAIVGSRDFQKLDKVREFVRSLSPEETTIVSGGARGVDSVAFFEAQKCGIKTVVFNANWEADGPLAGKLRNALIENSADECVAFWNGKSAGTLDTLEKFARANKPCKIIYENE